MTKHLTELQGRFVSEYLLDLNATQAAIRAGYSPATARQIGSENLSKPVIASEIGARLTVFAERNEMSVDGYVRDLEDRVRADIADLFDEVGDVLPIPQWPEVWRRGMVTRLRIIEQRFGGQIVSRRIVSIRFVDRTPLKYLLGKHLGVFK